MTFMAGYMSQVPRQVGINSLWDMDAHVQAPTTHTAWIMITLYISTSFNTNESKYSFWNRAKKNIRQKP